MQVTTTGSQTYPSSPKTGSCPAVTSTTGSVNAAATSDDLQAQYEALANKSHLTATETAQAQKLNAGVLAREYTAYYHYVKEANAAPTLQQRSALMAQYCKAYVAYYDSLSPTEQATTHYAGTRAGAMSDYYGWNQQANSSSATSGSSDAIGSSDPAVMLLENYQKALAALKASTAAANSTTADSSATDVTNTASSDASVPSLLKTYIDNAATTETPPEAGERNDIVA